MDRAALSAEPRKSYVELLRDPRWQRKRLEIFERDRWECVNCGAADKTLNVHHVRYLPGRPPWESPSSDLETYCDECHKEVTALKKRLKELIDGVGHHNMARVIGYIEGLVMSQDMPDWTIDVRTYEHASGIVDSFSASMTPEELFEALPKNGRLTSALLCDLEYTKSEQ